MSLPLVFEWVLRSSVMATFLVLFIILLKYLAKDRLGVKWHYYIWFLILLRLILPLAPQSSFSFFNLFTYTEQREDAPRIVNLAVSTTEQHTDSGYTEEQMQEFPRDSIAGPVNENVQFVVSLSQSKEPHNSRADILPFIWLMGLMVVALYALATWWTGLATIFYGGGTNRGMWLNYM